VSFYLLDNPLHSIYCILVVSLQTGGDDQKSTQPLLFLTLFFIQIM